MHRLQLLSLMRFLGETRVCICSFYDVVAVVAADVGTQDQTLCCCSTAEVQGPIPISIYSVERNTWTATYVYLVTSLYFWKFQHANILILSSSLIYIILFTHSSEIKSHLYYNYKLWSVISIICL